MKLCGIVTTYFPDLVDLEQNIRSYISETDHLIIWENTPREQSRVSELVDKLKNEKIEIRTTGQNEFLAKPFNDCMRWAKDNAYTHVLTMDQDSLFENGYFSKYINFVDQYDDDNIAIFAPSTDDSNSNSEFIERDSVITSGAIISLKFIAKIGSFREDFLMYMVDIEFCFRAKEKGYKIIEFPSIKLIHKEGYKKRKNGMIINNYSAQSTYFIIRNTILTWKLHPNYLRKNEKYYFYKYKIFFRLIKIIFENQSYLKIKAIFLGLMHGYKNKSGLILIV